MVSDTDIDQQVDWLKMFKSDPLIYTADMLLALKAERAGLRDDRDYWHEFQMKTDKAAVAILSTARAEALEEAVKLLYELARIAQQHGAVDASEAIVTSAMAVDALKDKQP